MLFANTVFNVSTAIFDVMTIAAKLPEDSDLEEHNSKHE